nr:hypothetical protein [Streptomyces sporangiiformans]
MVHTLGVLAVRVRFVVGGLVRTGAHPVAHLTNRYSVPVRLIGRTVRVMLHASELDVHDGQKEVTRHERLIAKGQARLVLDHYLEALVKKPGASRARDRVGTGEVRGQVHPGS